MQGGQDRTSAEFARRSRRTAAYRQRQYRISASSLCHPASRKNTGPEMGGNNPPGY
ncbi:hypothetical protein KCP73_24315 [Salmonella enterica subsp. enterica]|nr:hypothetical protein KCP73_24315 [Salmonella enterica subsp. enterica]